VTFVYSCGDSESVAVVCPASTASLEAVAAAMKYNNTCLCTYLAEFSKMHAVCVLVMLLYDTRLATQGARALCIALPAAQQRFESMHTVTVYCAVQRLQQLAAHQLHTRQSTKPKQG
jgi:hypothetical protein